MNRNVLITGGAGYIGSHVVELLVKKKFKVVIIDNLSRGFKKLINKNAIFIKADLNNTFLIKKIIINYKIHTIIHLAALTDVQESQKNKKKYYKNNVIGTMNLIKACKNSNVKNIIFSSSAGVYGNAKSPVKEINKLNPINYYSQTKLDCEKLIIKFTKEYKIQYFILRYFNVCGASLTNKIGIMSKKNNSLFKVVSKQSLKKKPIVNIFGKNFITKDGTSIRDFIHVSDLANIHFEIIKNEKKLKKSYILNCGYGKGYSILEIIKNFEKLIKKNIKIIFKKKRNNEIVISYSNNKKLIKLINWKPKFNNLNIMVKSSLAWEKIC